MLPGPNVFVWQQIAGLHLLHHSEMKQGEPFSEAQRTMHMPLRMHIIIGIFTQMKLLLFLIRPVSFPH